MTEPAAPTMSGSGLPAIGDMRNGLLFVATVTYVLGYATWAFYSADRGLGVLPPLQGQYFLAGALPAVILAGAAYAMRAVTPPREEAARKKAARWGSRFFFGGMLVFYAWLLGAKLKLIRPPFDSVGLPLWLLATYIGAALTARSGETGSVFLRWLFRLAMLPLMVLFSLDLYAIWAFPLIPREFGGPQPVCVQLDIPGSKISAATARLLAIDSTAPQNSARTGPLWLHFEGGGIVVVSRERGRPTPAPVRLPASDMPLITSTDCIRSNVDSARQEGESGGAAPSR